MKKKIPTQNGMKGDKAKRKLSKTLTFKFPEAESCRRQEHDCRGIMSPGSSRVTVPWVDDSLNDIIRTLVDSGTEGKRQVTQQKPVAAALERRVIQSTTEMTEPERQNVGDAKAQTQSRRLSVQSDPGRLHCRISRHDWRGSQVPNLRIHRPQQGNAPMLAPCKTARSRTLLNNSESECLAFQFSIVTWVQEPATLNSPCRSRPEPLSAVVMASGDAEMSKAMIGEKM
jgi:hypothetical protein